MKRCSRCHNLKKENDFIFNEKEFKTCNRCRKGEKPNKRCCSRCHGFKDNDEFKKNGYLMKTCNSCREKNINLDEINEIKEDLSNYKKHDILKKIYNEKEFIDLNYVLEMRKNNNCDVCGRLIQYKTLSQPNFGQIKRTNPRQGFIKGNVIISCSYCMAR